MMKQATLALWLTAALAAGCGDDKPTGPTENGDDAGGETRRDASTNDASKPDSAMPDASNPGPTDSGSLEDAGATDASVAIPACDASAGPSLPPLKLEAVPGVGIIDKLVFAAQPPGTADWYLVQQTGVIQLLSAGSASPRPFLDLSEQIALAIGRDDERGLLGLAFPPDYAQSKKFYVMMTPTRGMYANRDSLLEYTVEDGTPSNEPTAVILRLEASAENHNGGNIVFDKDGLLYVGTGDGGGGCNNNKPGAPQDPRSLFGKILRLNPKNASAQYAAEGNPFPSPDGDPRVLHYGLRNPYRFDKDRLTGDLYVGDVGQDAFEEVDFASSRATGLNFGWPKFEGAHESTEPGLCGPRDLRGGSMATAPLVDVARRNGPFADYKSIIVGAPYRGSAIPKLGGVLIIGDYVGARYQAVTQCAGRASPVTTINRVKDPNQPNVPGFSRGVGVAPIASLVAIVQDDKGELYFVANRNTLLQLVSGE